MGDGVWWAVGVLVLLIAVVASVMAVRGDRWGPRLAGSRKESWTASPPIDSARSLAAIIVNPTKVDDAVAERERIGKACADRGWEPPLWLETTADDPGYGQAQQALEDGASLVLPYGGDGTVRAVAAALAGSGVAMGLLPSGTGNLLARNLDLPVVDDEAALRIAFDGRNRTIDVGQLKVSGRIDAEGADTGDTEYTFCVMAGVGFDAAVMAGVDDNLKTRVGWVAYVVSGLRLLRGRQVKVQLAFDVGTDHEVVKQRRTRSVLVGNVGKLQGGMILLPDAEVDDGLLDAVSVAPTGVVGWAGVIAQIATRQRRGHRRVEHFRCRTVVVQCDRPEMLQVDGDPVGEATRLEIAIDAGALVVRVR